MFKKYLSPGDTSGGDPQDPPQDPDGQQDYKVKYEELSATHASAIAAAEKEKEALENRRAGIQSLYTKEQEAHKQSKTTLDQLKTQLSSTSFEKDAFSLQVTEKETALKERETELSNLNKKLTRANLIFSQFPQLGEFEVMGLLPDAEPDKMEEVFGKFAQTLGSKIDLEKKNFSKGQTPPPPPPAGGPPDGVEALNAKIFDAVRAGNTAEYNRLFEERLKLFEKSNS